MKRPLTVLLSLVLALTLAEAAARSLDGFALFAVALTRRAPAPSQPAPAVRPDLKHIDRIALAAGVDRDWYELTPNPISGRPLDASSQRRLDQYPNDPVGAFLAWNPEYLKIQLCLGNRSGSLGILSEFYVFDPIEEGPYPIFRHMPNFGPPGWFVSNAFGWRGPAIDLEKPPGTVRIAFVGASTTVSAFGYSFSHPELIGHWLNLFAASKRLPIQFEVINAGRMGIDSSSIAAIVRQEVLPVDPDLVIYYEGANQFAPGKAMRLPPAIPPSPRSTFPTRWEAENYSALALRLLTALSLHRGGDGREESKPLYPTIWPSDVNEQDPDVTHVPLPMDLDAVVRNLDTMRTGLQVNGSELAISSFIWMVHPGMVLDLKRHLNQYRYLNDTYWPATYAHMRRMADFQNRVFESYAKHHRLVYLDVARDFPRDPDLFSDAIHMTPDGLRLQAWTYLQELIPVITGRLASGRWPIRAAQSNAINPAAYSPHLVNRKDILAQCR